MVKKAVGNYFMPTYSLGYREIYYGGIIQENESLLTLATENAKKGIRSLKIIGNTPDEAISTFSAYEREHNSKDRFFDLVNSQPGSPSYAMGIYKEKNEYRICIVASKIIPATANVTDSGAYRLIEHPDRIDYLWGEL
jgi:hypothetical protein